jgi:hypothetical protein
MNKENIIHIHHGMLLSNKENEIMSFARNWMDLKIIVLNEISQVQKAK